MGNNVRGRLDPRSFYPAGDEPVMSAAFAGHTGIALKPVYDKLEGRIGYGKLRIFQAFAQSRNSRPEP